MSVRINVENSDRMTKWPSDWVTKWPSVQMTKWPSDQVTEWPNDWMIKWLNDWVTGWQEASQTIDRMVYFNNEVWQDRCCARPIKWRSRWTNCQYLIRKSATENGREEIREKLVEVCINKEIVEINDPWKLLLWNILWIITAMLLCYLNKRQITSGHSLGLEILPL